MVQLPGDFRACFLVNNYNGQRQTLKLILLVKGLEPHSCEGFSLPLIARQGDGGRGCQRLAGAWAVEDLTDYRFEIL